MKRIRLKFDISDSSDWQRAREVLLQRLEQKQPTGAIINHVTRKLVFYWDEPDSI